MKFWTMLLASVLVLALVAVVEGKSNGGETNKKAPHISGTVVSVATDGTSIVITEGKSKDGSQVTITTDSNTAVTIDKETGKKVTDLTPGLRVKITPTTGTATTITAKTKGKGKKKHKKGDSAPSTTQPTTESATPPVTEPATQPATEPGK